MGKGRSIERKGRGKGEVLSEIIIEKLRSLKGRREEERGNEGKGNERDKEVMGNTFSV